MFGLFVSKIVEFTKEKISRKSRLAENLNLLLSQSGISKQLLAEKTNLPYNTIHRIATGTTTDPKYSTLQAISSYFNISIDSLTDSSEPNKSKRVSSQAVRSVPIVQWEQLEDKEFSVEHICHNNWPAWQPIPMVSTDAMSNSAFAIQSRKSMFQRFPLGTVFIIDPETKFIDGDLILVSMKNDNAVSLREVLLDPPTTSLCSITGATPPVIYSDKEHLILGTVIFTMLQTRQLTT